MKKTGRFLNVHKHFVLAFVLSLILAASSVSFCAFAADDEEIPLVYDEPYTYTVRIFSGNQGSFADGETVREYTGLKAGDEIIYNKSDISIYKPGKYVLGNIRLSGKDNYDPLYPQLSAFTVKGDEDYVVTYQIVDDATQYTVYYVDSSGKALPGSKAETYYGNVGDKPTLAYKYFEGWYPHTKNLTSKELVKDASQNVLRFVYQKNPSNVRTVSTANSIVSQSITGSLGTTSRSIVSTSAPSAQIVSSYPEASGTVGSPGTAQISSPEASGTVGSSAEEGSDEPQSLPEEESGNEKPEVQENTAAIIEDLPEDFVIDVSDIALPASPEEVPELIDEGMTASANSQEAVRKEVIKEGALLNQSPARSKALWIVLPVCIAAAAAVILVTVFRRRRG